MSWLDEFLETISPWSEAVSVGMLRKWRSAGLEEAGSTLTKHRNKFIDTDGELSASKPPQSWTGLASDAARAGHAEIAQATRNLTAEVAAVRKATFETADAVAAIIKALNETEEFARSHGFTISDEGSVIDSDPPRDVAPDRRDEVRRRRTQARDEVGERLGGLLRRAWTVDQDLAAVLRKAIKDTFDAAGSLKQAAKAGAAQGELSLPKPPIAGSPAENAAWWDSLPAQERREIIENHPEWIGNLNGIPAEARDEANRARLESERLRLEEKIARIKNQRESEPFGPPYTAPYPRRDPELLAELEEAKRKLEAVEAIDRTLDDEPPRQLLLLDNSGEVAKAAVAIGNVDTAEHVAVFTPGFTTTVGGDLESYDQTMENLQIEAQQQSNRYGDGGNVATVTWIGYDAPQWGDLAPDDAVYNDAAAKQGGQALAEFYTGINASRDEDPHLTALGHSYGSTTTGYAMQQPGTGVDDVAFFGSPGLGTGDASDIKVPDGSVYNLEARHDPVADIGIFGGEDPNSMEGVTDLSTQETDGSAGDLKASTGHSEYLNEGTTSQHNIGAVVSGNEDRLIIDEQVGPIDYIRNPSRIFD